jgi:hypothetical protein
MKLAGDADWKIFNRGSNVGGQGYGASTQRDLRERKTLPTAVLTQVLKVGEGVAIGTLDGGTSTPSTRYVKVPFKDPGQGLLAGARPQRKQAHA